MTILRKFLVISALSAGLGCSAGTHQTPRLFYVPEGSTVKEYSPGLKITEYAYPFDKAEGAVIFIHGGGWQSGGSHLPQYQNWEPVLLAHRLRAFSAEHRTSPDFRGTEPVSDVLRALSFVRELSGKYNFPPHRISLIGFSSGGHLAVQAALTASASPSRYQGPHSVVAFYPPLDLKSAMESSNTSFRNYAVSYLPGNPVWAEVSPMEALHKRTPPILLIHGESDSLVPADQSIRFTEKAKSAGIKQVQLILVPGADHSFDQSRSSWARELELAAVRFITR